MQSSHEPDRPVAGLDLKDALLVGALVTVCSIFGIYTAPPGVLAAFWPTNAVLVGLLLRRAHPPGAAHWLAAIAGYIAADLTMRHGWPKTLMLTTTNLMGVSVCYGLLRRMSGDMRGLRHPRSMLRFVLVALSAAAAAGVGGTVIHPALFGGTRGYGFLFWFSTELVNYIAILPVLLTMPDLARRTRRGDAPGWRAGHLAPLAAFAGSLWLETQLGGPGVISFPIPAMLWCALTYSLFATAGITLLFSMWTLLAIASGMLAIGAAVDTPQAIMSLRVGVTLTALAPLAVASVMVARNELLARLQHAASHDPLTQVLNRGGFMTRAQSVQASAVLMMDIDFFKKVNDTHGHAAGDAVLTHFARVVAGCLRAGDVLGRLGGEEFAVLLPDCAPLDARIIAQRICDAFAAQPAVLEDGVRLHATVSIGLGCRGAPDTPIGTLLSQADAALYSAKHAGRNRVAS
ncbi:sensor domain-containing diguanylate cyclase [Massilia phosphatilytica]|nr:sensor domain-containing diguanylate cyclase [Massilia phosphatilytica]